MYARFPCGPFLWDFQIKLLCTLLVPLCVFHVHRISFCFTALTLQLPYKILYITLRRREIKSDYTPNFISSYILNTSEISSKFSRFSNWKINLLWPTPVSYKLHSELRSSQNAELKFHSITNPYDGLVTTFSCLQNQPIKSNFCLSSTALNGLFQLQRIYDKDIELGDELCHSSLTLP
jgi:hypothetical protein